MSLVNTKLLICVLAGVVAIAATLAQMQKTQTEHDAALMRQPAQQQVGSGIDWQEVDKRNKAMAKGQQHIVAPTKTAKSFSYQMP
jgi:Ni/Co efflux regulator RcnB